MARREDRAERRGAVVATVGASDADPIAADTSAVELETAAAVGPPGPLDPSSVAEPGVVEVGGAAVIGTRVASAATPIRSTRMARYPSLVPPTMVTTRTVDSSTKAHR